MPDAKPREPRGFTLRFVFKFSPEGLGSIVIASVLYRGRRLWMEAIFSADDEKAILQQFREAARIIFPEFGPIPFPRAAHKHIGAR